MPYAPVEHHTVRNYMYTLYQNRLGFKQSSFFFKLACSNIGRSHAVCTCGATFSDKTICMLFHSYNLKIDQVSNGLAYFLNGLIQTLEEVTPHAPVEQHSVTTQYVYSYILLPKQIQFQTVQLIYQTGLFKHWKKSRRMHLWSNLQ